MPDKNKPAQKESSKKEPAKKIFNAAGLLDLPEDEQDKVLDAMIDAVLGPEDSDQADEKIERLPGG